MTTGVGVSDCCLSGKLNTSSTPKGTEEQIGGLETYVSAPQDSSKSKAIIFITCDLTSRCA